MRQFVFDLFDTETHERRFICHEGDESRSTRRHAGDGTSGGD